MEGGEITWLGLKGIYTSTEIKIFSRQINRDDAELTIEYVHTENYAINI